MAPRTPTPAEPTPAAETAPAPQPAADLVRVKLAHFKDYDGKSYSPGAELEVPAETAKSWVWGGYAKILPAESAGESTP